MSIRTTEAGATEAEEPEGSRDRPDSANRDVFSADDGPTVVAQRLPAPDPVPSPAPLDEPEQPTGTPAPETSAPEIFAPEASAPEPVATGQDLGAEQGATRGGDVAVVATAVAVPDAPASSVVPVPAQDLAPAVPDTSDRAVRTAPIDSPTSLDAVNDASAVETAAGGSGSGPGSGGAPTDGKAGGRRPRKDPEGRMALREHLTELRKRVVRAGIFVLAGSIAGWFLYLPVIEYMTEPLKELAEDRADLVQINFSNVAASFDLQLKGAVWIGVIVSSPLWIYQLWAFITPGLTKKERRYAVGFVSAAVPLFLGGVFLASLFIPRAVMFFTSFTPDGGSNIIDAPTYISFVMRTVLTFGLSFLLPVVLVALNFAGLLSGRAILKAWRWVLVASLTFAAVATPTPDVTAMFTLAAPIIILFALAIVVCLLHDRRKAKRAPSYAGVDDDHASDLGDDEAAPL